jgi:hypothetical protein
MFAADAGLPSFAALYERLIASKRRTSERELWVAAIIERLA